MDYSMPGFPVLHHLSEFADSCPLSQWCHPTVSSSVTSLFSCPQSFPSWGSFPMIRFFISGGQSIRASASALVLPMNSQGWFPLGLTGLLSLQYKGLSRVFSNTTVQKASILWYSAFFMVQLSHPYMTTGKTIALTICIFLGKVMCSLFNMLSRLVISFLLRSKCLLISWVQSVCRDFGAQDNKVFHCFHCFPIYLPWSDWIGCHDLCFLNIEFLSRLFHCPLSPSSRGSSSFSLSAVRVVLSAYLRLLIFLPSILIPSWASSSCHFAWCTLHIS